MRSGLLTLAYCVRLCITLMSDFLYDTEIGRTSEPVLAVDVGT